MITFTDKNISDITHYYHDDFDNSDVVMISCLYPGPNDKFYRDRTDSLAGTHVAYAKRHGINYFCFNGNLLSTTTLQENYLFGIYKWFCAYYVTEVLGYKKCVVLDFDSRFVKYDVDFPNDVLAADFAFSNPHPFNRNGFPTVLYYLIKEGLPIGTNAMWYNTGLFTVTKGKLDIDFMIEFVKHAEYVVSKKVDFFMSRGDFTGNNNEVMFRANDEVFAQLLIRKFPELSIACFDYNWNTGNIDNPGNVLFHFTNKDELVKQCKKGNTLINVGPH